MKIDIPIAIISAVAAISINTYARYKKVMDQPIQLKYSTMKKYTEAEALGNCVRGLDRMMEGFNSRIYTLIWKVKKYPNNEALKKDLEKEENEKAVIQDKINKFNKQIKELQKNDSN
jgi:hypothetical protein